MKAPITERLKQFIEKQQFEYPFPLTEDVDVEKDLHITGDDAVEFILAFGKEFDVDVSHFPLADYFDGEGASADIIGLIMYLFRKKKKQKKILRLKDLDSAIVNKKLASK